MTMTTKFDKSKQELARNMVAAASTTAFCVSLLNPLDVLRIKWQTRPNTANQVQGANMLQFARSIIRNDGGIVRGLYLPGVGVNAASVACSSGFRLGLYPVTKDALSSLVFQHDDAQHTQPYVMMLSGFLSGALGFFLATPLFTAKIQAQSYAASSSSSSGWGLFTKQFREGHPFRGSSILVARGALFSAGFSAGYDGTKSAFRKRGHAEGPVIHATASVVAALLSTLMAAPFDSTLTRFQSGRTRNVTTSPLQCVMDMYTEGGVRIFFRGWSLFFSRVAPLFVIQLPMYEQTRRLLGMDFMK